MADGSIVYEVRVDSSNVDGDLARAGGLLEKGTKEIHQLAAGVSLNFGKMLGDVFGKSADYAEGAVSRLGAGFEKLKNAAAPLLNALAPVSRELLNISNLNLPNLGEVTGKAAPASTPKSTETPAKTSILSRLLPSFAVGTEYIPYDDFPALLHKGEAVLTASENAAFQAAGGAAALNKGAVQSEAFKNDMNRADLNEFDRRPVEVTLRIGDHEFTQIIADTMNNLYRQWGKNPLR
ncbi:MAG: hypothetical protein FWH08_03200 [Oscillospiraceae bacterium]|nr:hypothetical protein [Oscillospiraceae bacterium]